MGRSHAWVKRGEEYVEPRPMNWGDNLTLIGAMRADRWLTLGMCWRGVSYESFETWVRVRLAPRLRRGDIVLLDNLNAHKSPTVRQFIEARGATVHFLPRPDLGNLVISNGSRGTPRGTPQTGFCGRF